MSHLYYNVMEAQKFGMAFVTLVAFFAFRSAMIAGIFVLWKKFCATARNNPIIVRVQKSRGLGENISTALITLSLDALFSLSMIRLGLLRPEYAASGAAIALTVLLMFIWVEIYFYYSHRFLHRRDKFWIHKQHHEEIATSVWTSLRFSALERLVLLLGTVGVPGLASQLVQIPMEGIVIYFFLNYVLNVFGHWNAEIVPSSWLRYRIGRVLNTTTYHALHHLRFQGHYGLFTPFLDIAHGTYFADYREFQAERYAGAGRARETAVKATQTQSAPL